MSNLSKVATQVVTGQPDLVAALHELIAQLKKPQVSADDVLWTFSEIADYLKLSAFTVETKVVTRPDFPKALQPCLGSPRGQKRWFARDVMDWARQNSGNIPRGRPRR